MLIVTSNYKPGTWLSGWDNLHPEFNFPMNIKRSLYAVWQEYQGLGLLGGMGHAADLPRQLILWLLSVIVPDSLIRYLFHFSMLFIGSLGMYVLLKNIVLKTRSVTDQIIGALAGSIFYLFNLATAQMFNVPFEPYSTHYGFLPWLLYGNIQYMEKPSYRNLILLFVINILAVPQGYIPTFFLVYTIAITLIFAGMWFKQRATMPIIIAYLVLLFTNAFWLFPNLYFVTEKVEVTVEAKINQMQTQEFFLRNKKYGNLENIALLKGFWFDNVEPTAQGITQSQLSKWTPYLNTNFAKISGYAIFALSIIGLLVACIKRYRYGLIFVPVTLFSFVMLANDTVLISFVNSLIYKIPLISQIFRFPFTKLSLLFVAMLSIYFCFAVLWIRSLISVRLFKTGVTILLIILPLIYLLPIINGKLFYYRVQARIPKEYFELFDYFKTQPKGERIANFPQHSYSGWTFYNWDYSGSGFLWYGIEQPIIDRAFDVWSREDENYFNEISYAIYSDNPQLFQNILEKYQITWLLLDKNVINPDSPKSTYIDKLKLLLEQTTDIQKIKQFGQIELYRVNLQNQPKDFITVRSDMSVIEPAYKWNNYDTAYSNYGNYISSNTASIEDAIYYPFRSIFTGRSQDDIEFDFVENEDSIRLINIIPNIYSYKTLVIPSLSSDYLLEENSNQPLKIMINGQSIELNDQNLETEVLLDPIAYGGNNFRLEILIYKNNTNSYKSFHADSSNLVNIDCGASLGEGIHGKEIVSNQSIYTRITAQDSSECYPIYLPNLLHRIAYVVEINSRNISGMPLKFWLQNMNSQRADIETYLPSSNVFSRSLLIVPPMEYYGAGYTLHFDSLSFNKEQTINDLENVEVYAIPYKFITDFKVSANNQLVVPQNNNSKLTVNHNELSSYDINLSNTENKLQTLILSQSFDKGWHAFALQCENSKLKCQMSKLAPFIFGEELKDHVLVNNWANGWLLPNSNFESLNSKQITNSNLEFSKPTTNPSTNLEKATIKIVYLPQYLEYIGFVILLLTTLVLTIDEIREYKKDKKNK